MICTDEIFDENSIHCFSDYVEHRFLPDQGSDTFFKQFVEKVMDTEGTDLEALLTIACNFGFCGSALSLLNATTVDINCLKELRFEYLLYENNYALVKILLEHPKIQFKELKELCLLVSTLQCWSGFVKMALQQLDELFIIPKQGKLIGLT
jgi:hypothetical protein